MKYRFLPSSTILTFAYALLFSSAVFSAPKGDHLIGPTGLMAEAGKNELRVKSVDEGSPADGKMNKGDVIVGAGGDKFSANVREQMADAIEEAEAAGGGLSLDLKGGKKVDLKLRELGEFGRTAPWD